MVIKNMIVNCSYQTGFVNDKTIERWVKITDKRTRETIIHENSKKYITHTCHCQAFYTGDENEEFLVIEMIPWKDGHALTSIKKGQVPECRLSISDPSEKSYNYLKEKLKPREESESDV